MADPLEHIVYISIPEQLGRSVGDFSIDPEIHLPVEVAGGSVDMSSLSWEQIVAGMLKVLAYQSDHTDANYFREFVQTVSPNLITELTETAIIKAKNGDIEIAEEIFLALKGLQPDDMRPAMNLALLYEQAADAAEATGDTDAQQAAIDRTFEIYAQLLHLPDVPPEAHLNAGFFYTKQSNYDQALSNLKIFVQHADDEDQIAEAQALIDEISGQNLADTTFKEAYDFIQLGQEEEGIQRARRFLEANPNVWNGWFLLGWGLRRLSRYEDAKTAFKQALELGPRQVDTLNELAICCMETDETELAETLLKEALESEPENIKVISNLGIVAMKEQNTDEAAGYFRTVLEIEPEDRLATMYLEQLGQE